MYSVSISFLPYFMYIFGKKLTSGDFESNCNYLELISIYIKSSNWVGLCLSNLTG